MMNSFKEWSAEDIAFLRDNHQRMDVDLLAYRLRRTRPAVLRMAHNLGLKGLAHERARRKIPDYADITFMQDGKVLIRYDNRTIHLTSVPTCLCRMEIPV